LIQPGRWRQDHSISLADAARILVRDGDDDDDENDDVDDDLREPGEAHAGPAAMRRAKSDEGDELKAPRGAVKNKSTRAPNAPPSALRTGQGATLTRAAARTTLSALPPTAKVRRLYDIANILTALRVITRVRVGNAQYTKPNFQWSWPPLSPTESDADAEPPLPPGSPNGPGATTSVAVPPLAGPGSDAAPAEPEPAAPDTPSAVATLAQAAADRASMTSSRSLFKPPAAEDAAAPAAAETAAPGSATKKRRLSAKATADKAEKAARPILPATPAGAAGGARDAAADSASGGRTQGGSRGRGGSTSG